MATEIHPGEFATVVEPPRGQAKVSARRQRGAVRKLIEMLASLRLTVVLFAMAIFIVLTGTLAQVEKDIWHVVDQYFRTPVAWIDFQVFAPAPFFPAGQVPNLPGSFPFPGGWLIGALMAVNLLAAHSVRFSAQARGPRLVAGMAVLLAGALLTWLVIATGTMGDSVYEGSLLAWDTLWDLLKFGLMCLCVVLATYLGMMDRAKRVERRLLYGVLAATAGVTAYVLFGGEAARIDDSGMRILWQLIKGTVASAVLLAGCVLVFKKRAGIVLLHAGVGLMMVSEIIVGTTSTEAVMRILEGETVNFTEDIRKVELSVIDRSPADVDNVVVVPASRLKQNRTISDERLPFDIEVVQFMPNSVLDDVQPNDVNKATTGIGVQRVAKEVRPGSGTDSGSEVDMASAYVKLTTPDGAPLGTYLLSQYLNEQPMQVGDAEYDIALRFRREYQPYSIQLLNFTKEDYPGTDTPRDFSSEIRLVDESRDVDREVRIWMNNPMRFAGSTFYQSGYQPPIGPEGRWGTTLQVVSNVGWMIPYVACMIVGVGMLFQFCVTLLRFLNRRASAELAPLEGSGIPTDGSNGRARRQRHKRISDGVPKWRTAAFVVPAVVVLCAAGYLAGKFRPPSAGPGEMDLYKFGQLPVVYQGRTMPIDTLARNSLQIISDRETYLDTDDERQPAIRWFLDLIARPDVAFDQRVFRITNLELINDLGLDPQRAKADEYRYALADFQGAIVKLRKTVDAARARDERQLTTFDRKALELEQHIGVVDLLLQSFGPPDIRREEEHFRDDLMMAVEQQRVLSDRHPPLAVPPAQKDGTWSTYASAWLREFVSMNFADFNIQSNPATAALEKIFVAYSQEDTEAFNTAVDEYHTLLADNAAVMPHTERVDFEAYFNAAAPFFYSWVLYVGALALAAAAWLVLPNVLGRTTFWLLWFIFIVHTFALLARMYISGRPPVTNLYSSAVFIGWGCALFGLVLEMVYRNGFGNMVAALAGFGTLRIAHYLALDGDTFVVLQAVLDTQFWLATHVVCITLGYATTFVAGLLGVIYVLRGLLTPSLTASAGKDLTRMIYGTLCFALFFSFVGTVLGGLWADDSWGRFWGWDPKENGALIIVLWNALVLHARWAGIVKQRGLAVLAVAGNIATSWSWFGVNELGIGLHSYGFTEGVLLYLSLFVVSQLAIIAAAMLPTDLWLSNRSRPEAV